MGHLRRLVFASVLIGTVGFSSAESPAPAPAPDAKPIALVGGLIRTMTDAGDFVGTLVIRDGKIAALGPNERPPADAQVIDAAKCVIVPGLIDARGSLGLNTAASRESGSAAGLDIVDAIDPFDDDWKDAARQGVTAVYAQPSGPLGGSGAVLRVGPTRSAEGLVLKSPAAVQAALGQQQSAAAPAGNPQLAEMLARLGIAMPQQPAAAPSASNSLTRFAQAEQLRSQIDGARRYSENKSAKRDAPKELLARVVKKEIPLRLSVLHEDDVRNALKIAHDLGLRVVWENIDRPAVIPDEFAAQRSPLVVGPLTSRKPSVELKKLLQDGRRWAIGTFGDDPRATCGLRFHAASAVAAGLPRDAVLRALTADAADILGVGDKLGRLAAGRNADLVVVAGDPLDPSAPVRLTVCQGIVTHSAPNAEIAPRPAAVTATLPQTLPARYVLKTNRLLNESGEYAPGQVAVENGKLTSSLPTSLDVPTFDVGDAPITPGLVAGHVVIDSEPSPDADASHLRAIDGLTADNGKIRGYRDGGFLTAILAPGSNNVVSGVPAVLTTHDGRSASDAGMKFSLIAAARDRERYPVSLGGQVEFIDERLRGESGESLLHMPPSLKAAILGERERTLRALREQKSPAWFDAQDRTEIRAALRLIGEHKLRGVLLMPKQVEELTDEIRSSGAAVVLGPVRPQDADLMLRGVVALGKANVPLAFGGDEGDLRSSAATLVNAGLSRPTARRALIGLPATAFALPATTGKLAAGESADFVVWDGDVLDTASKPLAVVAQGQRVAAGKTDETRKKAAPAPQPAPTRRGRG